MSGMKEISEMTVNGGQKLLILHADADIVVAVKPAGVESQASASGSGMVPLLKNAIGGEIYPVHRLDRETRGVMVYARTAGAASALSEEFRSGLLSKHYLAVLLGMPDPPEGELSDLLYHDARRNKSYVVSCSRRGVREASLSYRVAANDGILTLVTIRLHTGRTHQIRVQFASRGKPVYGDRRYGGKPDRERWGIDDISVRGIALACVSLKFRHPGTGETVSFEYAPKGEVWDRFDIAAATSSLGLIP